MVNNFWGIFNNENIDLILENKEIKIKIMEGVECIKFKHIILIMNY